MNVNDVVYCKLTKRGAFLLNDQNRELMMRFPNQKLKCDYRAGDLYEQYFWVVMKHWGSYFEVSKEAPFTDVWNSDNPRFQEGEVVVPPKDLVGA